MTQAVPTIRARASGSPGFCPRASITSRCRAKNSRKVTVGAIKLPSASTDKRNITINAQGLLRAKRLVMNSSASRRRKPVSFRAKVSKNENIRNHTVALPKEDRRTSPVFTPGRTPRAKITRALGQPMSTNSHSMTAPKNSPRTRWPEAPSPGMRGRRSAPKSKMSETPTMIQFHTPLRFSIRPASSCVPRLTVP